LYYILPRGQVTHIHSVVATTNRAEGNDASQFFGMVFTNQDGDFFVKNVDRASVFGMHRAPDLVLVRSGACGGVRGELLNLAENTSATQSCESFTYR
jgi:hypothetical protein